MLRGHVRGPGGRGSGLNPENVKIELMEGCRQGQGSCGLRKMLVLKSGEVLLMGRVQLYQCDCERDLNE